MKRRSFFRRFLPSLSSVSALLGAIGLFSGGCGSAGSTAFIPAVENFDPQGYEGVWYEIARLPNFFEKDMTHVQACYTLQSDGSIVVVNSGRKNGAWKEITGKARLLDPEKKEGELEVSFFGPFYSAYRIVDLDENGQTAIVCGSDMDLLWILAPTPEISI